MHAEMLDSSMSRTMVRDCFHVTEMGLKEVLRIDKIVY